MTDSQEKINKSKQEWKEILEKEAYKVTREAGTERPFSGEYNDFKGEGDYHCVCCGALLFHSAHKYDSGTGWPSFFAPATETAIEEREDRKLFRTRTETLCAKCDAHLGHVFEDGPEPTGQRYCMNSVALKFKPKP